MIQRNTLASIMPSNKPVLFDNISIQLPKQMISNTYSYNNTSTNSFINSNPTKKLTAQFPYEVFTYARKSGMHSARICFKQVRTHATDRKHIDVDTDNILNDMKELKEDCVRILQGHDYKLPILKPQSSRLNSNNWGIRYTRPKVTINVNSEFFINKIYSSERTRCIRLPPIKAKSSLHIPMEEEKKELNETGYFPESNSKKNQEIKAARATKRTSIVKINFGKIKHKKGFKQPQNKTKEETIINVTFNGEQSINNKDI